jgi:CRISPR-associated endonuclease/helicase Cas3
LLRATSNQVYDEFSELADGSAQVHLIHSTADDYLAAVAARARAADPYPSEVGVDEPDDQDGYVREWFIRAKSLLVPLGVGTVDQLLKAVIRSRHGFVRLAGLSGKVVILDEIHAYDTYMSTLIDRLLEWLGYLGVPVILLSATLPSSRRHGLVVAWQAGARRRHPTEISPPPISVEYPRITYVDAAGEPACVPAAACELNKDRSVRLLRLGDDQVVERALEWAARSPDASVAVIHNLVGRAKDTFQQLQDAVQALPRDERPQLGLVHGQLGARQRQEVEERLRTAFRPEGIRVRAIVVGTQVLEQSLDLDFDAMITDLAPIDSLIQRFGRLHRHRRDADRGELVAAVIGVEDHASGPTFPRYTTTVYARMVLLKTWAVLRDREFLRCPEEVPVLVDQVYDSSEGIACPAGWETQWQEAGVRLARDRDEHAKQAEERYLPPPGGSIWLHELTSRSHSPNETRRRGGRYG